MLSRLAIASVAVGVALAALLGGAAGARAGVVIVVNKSTQRLSVSVDGAPRYEWPVSTARQGYNTPNGTYGVERMEVSWFSRRSSSPRCCGRSISAPSSARNSGCSTRY